MCETAGCYPAKMMHIIRETNDYDPGSFCFVFFPLICIFVDYCKLKLFNSQMFGNFLVLFVS